MKRPISQQARDHGERAIEVLAEIMDDWAEESQHRIRAAEAILDRGYGKAAQAVVAVPLERAQREAAALLSDDELTDIINGEFEEIPAAPALTHQRDPLLE